jgi:hypothetical protein
MTIHESLGAGGWRGAFPASWYPKMAARRERGRVLTVKTSDCSSAMLYRTGRESANHRMVRDAAGADHQAAPDGGRPLAPAAGGSAPVGPSGP